MTQDEIIGMAKEAGFHVYSFESQIEQFNRFTKLVEDKVRQEIIEKNAPVIKKVNEHIKELQDAVKAEREACAKVCDMYAKNCTHPMNFAENCAEVIRERD
jgi:DNA-binding transcriptional regulator GbsR (MarR family)